MSYMHIENLYKNQTILLFKKCYAMEKIHGSSAHISFKIEGDRLTFFSGGESQDRFENIFNKEELMTKFKELNLNSVTIFGEVYGGKCQGMSETYGKDLRFVAFDVKIGDSWISVPQAESFVKNLNLEFVHYDEVETSIELLDKLASAESIQAIRNGMSNGKKREGIVLRPLIEATLNNGARIIVKHKNQEFSERIKQPRVQTEAELKVLSEANEIADEWVTEMRLSHVLDKFPNAEIKDTPLIIKAMIEDVFREAKGEIIENNLVEKAISKRVAGLFKKRIMVIKEARE